jgi:ribonuclease HI
MKPSAEGVWRLRCDGGARGNPGPAAYGFVLVDPAGREVAAHGEFIGNATNNVAEYRALIAGLDAAADQGVPALEVVMDSELVVRQMTGQYRVKNEGLKPLHAQARRSAARLPLVTYASVRRDFNARADALVNEALDRVLGPESPR